MDQKFFFKNSNCFQLKFQPMKVISVLFDKTTFEFNLPNSEITLKDLPTDGNTILQTLSFCSGKAKEIENHRNLIKRVLIVFNLALFLLMTTLISIVLFKLSMEWFLSLTIIVFSIIFEIILLGFVIYLSVVTPRKYIRSKYQYLEEYLKFENETKYLQVGISFQMSFENEMYPSIEILVGELDNVQSVGYFHPN